jgi:hypothetical protein
MTDENRLYAFLNSLTRIGLAIFVGIIFGVTNFFTLTGLYCLMKNCDLQSENLLHIIPLFLILLLMDMCIIKLINWFEEDSERTLRETV